MSYRILTLKEKEEWSKSLEKLPFDQQDIYYTPEYYELYENNGDGSAMCFVYEANDDIALYPFLMNSVNDLGYDLNETYFDIQGAYGYNGVVTSNNSISFIKSFQEKFTSFCRSSNVIAEFTRFNPIIKNQTFSGYLNIIKENKNIILDLKHTEKEAWEVIYDRSVRKNINKATRSGLVVKHFKGNEISDKWCNEFNNIYTTTLKRRNADNYYYFNNKYYSNLNKNLGDSILYFFTIKENKPISCELVTFKNYNAYSFLGGTLSEYFSYRPNDILKHEIINYLRKIGVKHFCLGGGIEEGDGIYKYKKSFAKNGDTDFFIGKKIHKNEIYDKVSTVWDQKYIDEKKNYSNFLLRYRL
jgi:hypothetical protein